MNTQEILDRFYGAYDEDARLTSRHGSVEYLTTLRYAKRYLTPGSRILEIGAATGRYSHTFARAGYAVDAVEPVERNIALFRQNTRAGEQVTLTRGFATDLSAFADGTYDLTLLLGPMYHLFTDEDKRAALREAVRVTKPGGVIFVAYCMADPSILSYCFRKGNLQTAVDAGILDPKTFQTISNPDEIFELHTKAQIDALRADLPVTQLHFVAADGYTNHMREEVDAMDDATFDAFLRYHFLTCERQDLIGLSHHTIDVFRKDG